MKKYLVAAILLSVVTMVFIIACDKVKPPYTNKISVDGSSVKRVLCEEGTSTSCTNCLQGTCTLEKMIAQYPNNFIPVAFHSENLGPGSDPMNCTDYNEYDNLFANSNGLPCVVLDRKIMNQYHADYPSVCSEYATEMSAAVTTPPIVSINITNLKWDNTLRNLSYTVQAVVLSNFNCDYRFNGILTEDSVHGTTSAWNQINGFSGNLDTTKCGCGFQNLPNPVPAASMYYNHVARYLFDGWNGVQGSISTTTHFVVGDTLRKTYTYNSLPAGWNASHINVIGFVIKHDDGTIVNACQAEHVGK